MGSQVSHIFTFGEVIFSYAQNINIISEIGIEWPSTFKNLVVYFKTICLNIDLSWIPSAPKIDYRSYFLILVVLLPLVLSFLMLFFFKPFGLILWYFFLLFSFALLVAGAFGYLSPLSTLGSAQIMSANGFLISGGAVLAVCLFIACIYAYVNKSQVADFAYKTKKLMVKISRKKKGKTGEPSGAEKKDGKEVDLEKPPTPISEASSAVSMVTIGLKNEKEEKKHAQDEKKQDEKKEKRKSNNPRSSVSLETEEEKQEKKSKRKSLVVTQIQATSSQKNLNIDPGKLEPVADMPPTGKVNEKALQAWRDSSTSYDHLAKKTVPFLLILFGVSVVFILAGLILTRIVDILGMVGVSKNSAVFSLGLPFGIAALSIGGVLAFYFLCCLSTPGRKVNRWIASFFDSQFIRILLFVLSIFYTPITNAVFTSWTCRTISCPYGSYLPFSENRVDSSNFLLGFLNHTIKCTKCNFAQDVSCPWGGTCTSSLCPGESTSRLLMDPGVDCSQGVKFFLPISIIMSISVVIGIPILYIILIKYHSAFVQQLQVMGDGVEKRWEKRVSTTVNSAKSIYASFEYKWRYYNVAMMMNKLMIVITSVMMASKSLYVTGALTIINLLFFLVVTWVRPFLSSVLDWIASVALFCLLLCSSFGVLIALGYSVNPSIMYIVGLLAFILPVIGLLVGFFIEMRMAKKVAQEPDTQKIEPHQIFIMDWHLNKYTLKVISSFFIFVGAAAFISLSIACVGIFFTGALTTPVVASVEASASFDSATQNQFVGYGQWGNFTQNCCCMQGTTNAIHTKVELWKCRNGKYKEKYRQLGDGQSGIPLRGFCSRNFDPLVVREIIFLNGKYIANLQNAYADSFSSQVYENLW